MAIRESVTVDSANRTPVERWMIPVPGTTVVRERILDAATALFYAHGIHPTGINEIVRRAETTKVTLYRHFPSKEDLALAYLRRRADFDRTNIAEASKLAAANAAPAFDAIAENIGIESYAPGFRGCPFINAAAEYGDADNPVRQLVDSHRAWFKGAIEQLLEGTRVKNRSQAAAEIVMLRDGAMVSGYLGNADEVAGALRRASQAVIDAHSN